MEILIQMPTTMVGEVTQTFDGEEIRDEVIRIKLKPLLSNLLICKNLKIGSTQMTILYVANAWIKLRRDVVNENRSKIGAI